jgi:hypothetical protein
MGFWRGLGKKSRETTFFVCDAGGIDERSVSHRTCAMR